MNGQILGVGIDIENIDRFKKLNLSRSNKFLNKIFTPAELDYCFSKKNIASNLATKYTGKEAIIKAYNTVDKTNISYKEIEITNDSSGAPGVNLKGNKKYHIMISLSSGTHQAVGVAIVINKKPSNG